MSGTARPVGRRHCFGDPWRTAYIMPPIAAMSAMALPEPLGTGRSATMASVVTSRPATEAASSSAMRTTLVGSMIPASSMSTYTSIWASKPKALLAFSQHLARDDGTVDAGVLGDLAQRLLDGAGP